MNDKHILLVDDEADFRLSMALLLERQGYSVTEANNGLHALGIITGSKPGQSGIDLVITDIKMPLMSGLELMDAVKEKNIPLKFLVVTGHGTREVISDLDEKGCNRILHKPFDEEELLQLLSGIFTEKG